MCHHHCSPAPGLFDYPPALLLGLVITALTLVLIIVVILLLQADSSQSRQ
jgi:hypothetical protein